MTLRPGLATERFIECCTAIADDGNVTSARIENRFGQTITEITGCDWRLRTSLAGFGLGLAAAIDENGATLVMIHPTPGPAGDLFDMIHQARTADFAAAIADRFRKRVRLSDAWHPASDLPLARSARDAAASLMGAVVEALPDTSFASAMIQWGPAGCFASIGCDQPIGDPKRPLVGPAFERRIVGMTPPLTLREGSAWETVADQIVPDLGSVTRMGVVIMDATVETQVERDALSYLRAVGDGREASSRLDVPVGERLIQPPI